MVLLHGLGALDGIGTFGIAVGHFGNTVGQDQPLGGGAAGAGAGALAADAVADGIADSKRRIAVRLADNGDDLLPLYDL